MIDVVVIGGGIAGLYTSYQYLKRHPGNRLIVLEKSSRELGGRVQTYHDAVMDVEIGAGRINQSHRLVMGLITELGLGKHLVSNGNEIAFMSTKHPGHKIHSPLDIVSRRELDSLGIRLKKHSSMPFDELIAKLVRESRKMSKRQLQSMTFREYAEDVIGESLVQVIIDTFGYYSEIVIMNAYDSLQLMRELDPTNRFYGMKGGLSQIIDGLVSEIRNMGGTIVLGQHVVGIRKLQPPVSVIKRSGGTRKTRKLGYLGGYSGFQIQCKDGAVYWAKKCVCALPKQSVERLEGGLFDNVLPSLAKIECGTLCRIYSQFDKGPDGKVWFQDLGKLTVDNDLRMIIPIDMERGIVMISYSDNQWADKWHNLYKNEGIGEVNRRLRDLVSEVVGVWIPLPKHTHVFYWPCGVGYWSKGADSAAIERRLVEPCPGLFVCGEHYSSGHQQWMEGALRTSKHVISRL
jgi:monoamine oxidase